MSARTVVRHVVLDSEAVSALLSRRPSDRRRAEVVLALAAANGRAVVPTAVRVEAGWRRGDPRAAEANRLVTDDDVLDTPGADRAVQLRREVPGASPVDAAVAVAVERLPAGDVVEVLTSDVGDLRALTDLLAVRVDVRGL